MELEIYFYRFFCMVIREVNEIYIMFEFEFVEVVKFGVFGRIKILKK